VIHKLITYLYIQEGAYRTRGYEVTKKDVQGSAAVYKILFKKSIRYIVIPTILAIRLPCLINGTFLLFRVGVILNHILNHVLKKYFAEPRPMFRDVVFEASFPPLPCEYCKHLETRSVVPSVVDPYRYPV
jgi:hypothetical protein